MSGAMISLSVLDLSPIPEGSDAAHALANTRDLARHVEGFGYHRYWLAEHHNIPGIASAATSIVIAQVAGATSRIRVGAGGIMLPNHAPLVIAEQFGTLASLFPGRIDLGLGRAPGGDQLTAQALRRTLVGGEDRFPRDVVELQHYFQTPQPGQAVVAVPGAGLDVPIWILGSSTFGAQLAAYLGLPYAFASHFAPVQMEEAIAVYRAHYRPSEKWPKPHLMLAMNVFAAETDEDARFLFTSLQQAFVNLRTGRPGKLPPPVANYEQTLPPTALRMLEQSLVCSAVGSKETVRAKMADFIAKHAPDELIITGQIFDHAARIRSFELAAQAHGLIGPAA